MPRRKYKRQSKLSRLMQLSTPNEQGHWLWDGATKKDGYGIFGIRIGGKQHCTTAHRAMYKAFFKKNVPKHIDIAHRPEFKCPRNCINPSHLYEATRKQNIADAIAAGTFVMAPGYPSKFTEQQKRDIVAQVRPQSTNIPALAKEFKVSVHTITGIVHSKTRRKETTRRQRLTWTQVLEIRKRYKFIPWNVTKLAKQYGVAIQTIGGWRRGFERVA